MQLIALLQPDSKLIITRRAEHLYMKIHVEFLEGEGNDRPLLWKEVCIHEMKDPHDSKKEVNRALKLMIEDIPKSRKRAKESAKPTG